MTHRIFIEFFTSEGFVVRVLGLIERRGFAVRRIAMAEDPGGRRASLALEVAQRDPGRSVETLTRQLHRLHGIASVNHERTFFFQEHAA